MKAILFIILMTLFSQNASAHRQVEGGVSGGGGNLLSPTPPKEIQDPREIRAIIKGSKFLLKKFINAKYSLFKSGSMDSESLRMYSVLFADNDDNLHEAMEEIALDIKLDEPCFDRDGVEHDGSTLNQKRHSICISAFSIAKKCDKEEVPLQSTALIFHEYSEVVGLSDIDAIKLQKQVLDELKVW